jgi:glycosyltransferase involved in cell wall biosynthesis
MRAGDQPDSSRAQTGYERGVQEPALRQPNAEPLPITIVVPCFNEAEGLGKLFAALRSFAMEFERQYEVHCVLVDDGSTDRTWQVMQAMFCSMPRCSLVRQRENIGIAGTILNGISHATTEIVCSMDSDCTYDPRELQGMIPRLAQNVDVVTGSPYHRDGHVVGVPWWRLQISKSASLLYRCVLRQKLATYTSCFRVYRRSAVLGVYVSEMGYAGVGELLGRLDLRGARILEHPTTLRVRTVGRSKMKLLQTAIRQLRVLGQLSILRLRSQS